MPESDHLPAPSPSERPSRGLAEALDAVAWGREHWKISAVLSLNYLLDGIIFSLAPLVTFLIAPDAAPLIFTANLLSESAGAILLGGLADRHGRKRMFVVSIAIEGIASILLLPFYTNLEAFTILTSMMTFGVGGEFGSVYAAVAELMPARHRGKVLMLVTNFWNVGSALIAGLALVLVSLGTDLSQQLVYLIGSAVGMLLLARTVRFVLPESPRWLVLKGRAEEASKLTRSLTGMVASSIDSTPSRAAGLRATLGQYSFRFSVLAVVTVAQYVVYNMTAYYAPYSPGFAFSVDAAPLVIFVANLGASVGALLLLPLIDRKRRLSNLLAFAGGFAGSVGLTLAHMLSLAPLFYALLFVTLIFVEWAWASLSVLSSELFPTGVRASVIGLLTSLTGVGGSLAVLSEPFMTANLFLTASSLIWFFGLLAAAAWQVRGVESASRTVEELLIPQTVKGSS